MPATGFPLQIKLPRDKETKHRPGRSKQLHEGQGWQCTPGPGPRGSCAAGPLPPVAQKAQRAPFAFPASKVNKAELSSSLPPPPRAFEVQRKL